jgi:hypothetical protein
MRLLSEVLKGNIRSLSPGALRIHVSVNARTRDERHCTRTVSCYMRASAIVHNVRDVILDLRNRLNAIEKAKP